VLLWNRWNKKFESTQAKKGVAGFVHDVSSCLSRHSARQKHFSFEDKIYAKPNLSLPAALPSKKDCSQEKTCWWTGTTKQKHADRRYKVG